MSNIYVLRCFLKQLGLGDSLMVLGRPFHSLGPATLNDLSVNIFLLVKGIQRRVLSHVDLKPNLDIVDFNSSSSIKYDGARPLRYL